MNAEQTLSTPSLPWQARLVLGQLERVERGELELALPDGSLRHFRGREPGPRARLQLHDWSAFTALLRGADVGFAESYRDGGWDCDDLTDLLLFAQCNRDALQPSFDGNPLVQAFHRVRHLLRSNTRRGSRRNIHAHYDLGNDFYRLWLDPTMTYSSALFSGQPMQCLASAQTAKYQRILDQLQARPGDHILEIGCGWGGFAEHAARQGMRVTGITLSTEQLAFARERIEAAGLSDLATFELRDYRDLDGQYDHIASIEMFEAVGERWWKRYFQCLGEHLAPGGRAVVQSIVIDEAAFPRYRRRTDFIQQYIFPGGMLPTTGHLEQLGSGAGLQTRDLLRFGQDYAETLRRWHQSFRQQLPEIEALGYDRAFQRIWAFYLSYCEAAFLSGQCDVVHVSYQRA